MFSYALFVILLVTQIRANIFNYNFQVLSSPKSLSYAIGSYLSVHQEELSLNCTKQLTEYVKGLWMGDEWALKMYDASGKLPSGVLDGNYVELGVFDECLNVATMYRDENETKLSGKYCLGYLYVNNTKVSTMTLFGCVALFMVLSTIYDLYNRFIRNCVPNWILSSFSVYKNGKELFATKYNSEEIQCLYGLRVLAMVAIVIGHTFWALLFLPIRNEYFVDHWVHQVQNMWIVKGDYAVDTFFVLSGILVSYSFMLKIVKNHKFNIIQHYLNRYLRLTPSVAAFILFVVGLFKFLGSGPMWPSFEGYTIEPCKEHWWYNLLYISNYANCLGPTWYLSVDFQLFLISPILLILLKRWPKHALVAIAFLIGCCLAVVFTMVWIFELRPSTIAWYLLIVAVTLCFICIFSAYPTLNPDYSKIGSALHLTIATPAFSICIGWIIYCCHTGNGGIINSFLSHSVFKVLSNFTYTIYLVHYPVIIYTNKRVRVGNFVDNFGIFVNRFKRNNSLIHYFHVKVSVGMVFLRQIFAIYLTFSLPHHVYFATLHRTLFGCVALFMVLSTIYDLYNRFISNCVPNWILSSFSVYKNGKELFVIKHNSEEIECLHGLRVLAMVVIVIFHSFFALLLLPIRNELTPSLAAFILFVVGLLKFLGSGPMWPSFERYTIEPCKEDWWYNLLYISNFTKGKVHCLGPTWYLSVDFQFFLISPILLILLKRWPKPVLVAIAFLIGCCLAVVFAMVWIFELRTSPIAWYLLIVAVTLCFICIFSAYPTLNPDYSKIGSALHLTIATPTFSICIGWIIYCCHTGNGGVINSFLSHSVFKVLSNFTYTIYLVHYPVIMYTNKRIRVGNFEDNFGIFVYSVPGYLFLSFLLGLLLSLAVELPVQTFVNVLMKKLKAKKESQ
ncbi:hypothetical protein RI129_013028 [Pyrocoelia pectoralis]|uniref:Nose resistant-to-fluoxetine protein N-terminal domain-containing protein n=1 Tax=Pyrocoelia pectoralis TaxID=417401 RepID=A0AAN7V3U2_9COLE